MAPYGQLKNVRALTKGVPLLTLPGNLDYFENLMQIKCGIDTFDNIHGYEICFKES